MQHQPAPGVDVVTYDGSNVQATSKKPAFLPRRAFLSEHGKIPRGTFITFAIMDQSMYCAMPRHDPGRASVLLSQHY